MSEVWGREGKKAIKRKGQSVLRFPVERGRRRRQRRKTRSKVKIRTTRERQGGCRCKSNAGPNKCAEAALFASPSSVCWMLERKKAPRSVVGMKPVNPSIPSSCLCLAATRTAARLCLGAGRGPFVEGGVKLQEGSSLLASAVLSAAVPTRWAGWLGWGLCPSTEQAWWRCR